MTGLGIITGNYISGSNVIAIENQRQYPYQAVQRGQMPPTAKYCGTWPGQSWRSFICVTDAATRKVFHDQIRMQWESIPAPLHLVDNAASYEGGPLGVQPWADQCANMKEINAVAQSLGQKVVFNVAWVPHQISAMDMATLVDATLNVMAKGNTLTGGEMTLDNVLHVDHLARVQATQLTL